MICPKCQVSEMSRVATKNVPVGGFYWLCDNPVCAYGFVAIQSTIGKESGGK